MIVTIDGPSGAGKSTVSRSLAQRLGYRYLDTGAMYRAFAYYAHSRGAKKNSAALASLIKEFSVQFVYNSAHVRVFIDSEDISEEIRKPSITALASQLSAGEPVRRRMTDLQRELGAQGDIVAEGRDMGTVVFPHAEVKFFLDADVSARARRRFEELRLTDPAITFQEVFEDIKSRDDRDRNREIAPLKAAHDAIVIDSTDRTAEEVVEEMRRIVLLKNTQRPSHDVG